MQNVNVVDSAYRKETSWRYNERSSKDVGALTKLSLKVSNNQMQAAING